MWIFEWVSCLIRFQLTWKHALNFEVYLSANCIYLNISVQQLHSSPGVGCFQCVWHSLRPMCWTVPPASGLTVIYLVPYVTPLYKRYMSNQYNCMCCLDNILCHSFTLLCIMYICISVCYFIDVYKYICYICFMIHACAAYSTFFVFFH